MVERARAAGGRAGAARGLAPVRPPIRRGPGRPGCRRARRTRQRRGLVLAGRDPPRACRLCRSQPRLRRPGAADHAAAGRGLPSGRRFADRPRRGCRELAGRRLDLGHRCRPGRAFVGADADGRNCRAAWRIRGRRTSLPRSPRAGRGRRLFAGGLCRLPARPRPPRRGSHPAQGRGARRRPAAAAGNRGQGHPGSPRQGLDQRPRRALCRGARTR